MKKIKYLTAGLLSFCLFQACSEDKMDEINENTNNPINVPSRLIITDVMTASAFSLTGADLSFYTGVYTELHGGGHNQMYRAQIRSGEPQLSATYNNMWNASYIQLRTLKIIIDKCSTGEEAGNYHTLGIAKILYSYNLAMLTDLFGDVPHSEALQPIANKQPKLDKQEDIYNEVIAGLEEGILELSKTTGYASLGNQDPIYRGEAENWIKAANGLLARYTMRLSHRTADYAAVIAYADASFVAQSEEMKFVNAQVPNPFARFHRDRTALFVSKSFYEKMLANGPADARTESFFTKLETTPGSGVFEVKPLDNAQENPLEGQNLYSISALMSESNPIYMMSYHELLFLKAEAQARLGQDTAALETLEKALIAAFTKTQRVTFTAEQATTYFASLGTLTGNDLLKKIMLEKYISFYENEAVEAYNDIRRLNAMGNVDFIPLVHPSPTKFPQRLSYGNSDVSRNPNVQAAYGDGSYVYTEKVWWAGGTR